MRWVFLACHCGRLFTLVNQQKLVEGRGFELVTFRLRGAILESFLLNRLKSWAYCGPTVRVPQKKGLGEIA